MLPDLVFEAAFLRAALLLGVVHEREVTPWAEELLLVQADAEMTLDGRVGAEHVPGASSATPRD